jgi:hypothetical protein
MMTIAVIEARSIMMTIAVIEARSIMMTIAIIKARPIMMTIAVIKARSIMTTIVIAVVTESLASANVAHHFAASSDTISWNIVTRLRHCQTWNQQHRCQKTRAKTD